MKVFRWITNSLGRVVKSNTGFSTLSWIAVGVGLIAMAILLGILVCMLIEMIANKTIASSLDGYASIIREVAILLTSVCIPKAINNYGENKFKGKDFCEEDDV